jgi:hypothetical protein
MRRKHIHTLPGGLNDPNAACHTFSGQVPEVGDETMGTPRVFAIFWSDYYVADGSDPASNYVLSMFSQYIAQLIGSSYMDGLTQYGINRGVFLGSLLVSSSETVPSNPLPDSQVQANLENWINSGSVPGPSGSYDSLYVVFTPQDVVVTFEGLSSATDFAGYHSSATFNTFLGWGKQNLFYAVIPWPNGFVPGPASPADLLTILGPSISHEMVEAFTDRNGNGWNVNVGSTNCEICDICELQGAANVFGWPATKFWSNADRACIPLSPLQNYLIVNAAGQIDSRDFSSGPLAQLQLAQNAQLTPLNVVFPPTGGWLVIWAENNYFASGIPQDAFNQIGNMVSQGNTVTNVIFPPAGGWWVIGENNYRFASGVPQDAFDEVESMIAGGETLLNIVFAPSGGWLIICENNEYSTSDNFQVDVEAAIAEFINDGGSLQNVVFFPNWSALVIGADGDYLPAGAGFPINVIQELETFVGGNNLPEDPNFLEASQLANLIVGPLT